MMCSLPGCGDGDKHPSVSCGTDVADAVMDHAPFYVGDTANPECIALIPWRGNLVADTNWWYHDSLWADRGAWGSDADEDSFETYARCWDTIGHSEDIDSNIIIHAHWIYADGGWPRSSANPPRFWIVGTPFGVPGAGDCIENPNLFCAQDPWNWTNRVDTGSADTIANPLWIPEDIIIDSVFWYEAPTGRGMHFYDTGSVATAKFVSTWIAAKNLADPDIFLADGGHMWIVFIASFTERLRVEKPGYREKLYDFYKPVMSAVYAANSVDGIHWSKPRRLTRLTADLVCPVICASDEGKYFMWQVAVLPLEGRRMGDIYRFSADSINQFPWMMDGLCTLRVNDNIIDNRMVPPMGKARRSYVFHIDVNRTGADEYEMIAGCKRYGVFENTEFITLGRSCDGGMNFEMQEISLLEHGEDGAWDDSWLYSPSQILIDEAGQTTRLVLYSGHGGKDSRRHTGVAVMDFPDRNIQSK